MQHFIPPTPRAAEAIIAQILSRGETDGEYCAPVLGVEVTFEAWFTTEWERDDAYDGWLHLSRGAATCTLIGAYAYDDNGDVVFAGNRAELADLIGAAEVARWEDEQAGREMGQ